MAPADATGAAFEAGGGGGMEGSLTGVGGGVALRVAATWAASGGASAIAERARAAAAAMPKDRAEVRTCNRQCCHRRECASSERSRPMAASIAPACDAMRYTRCVDCC